MSVLAIYVQDPDDKLDYTIDWSIFLGAGDEIADSTWVVPTGLDGTGPPAPSHTTTMATVWLKSGVVGNYIVKNKITTTGGRIREEAIRIRVRAN